MPSTDKCEVAVCADTNTCGNLKQLETDQTLKPRANVRNLDGLLMQLCTIERNLNIQPDIEKEAQHRDTQKKIDIKLKTLKKPNERHRTDKDLLDLRRHQTGPHVKEHIHDRRPHRGSAEHPCKTQAFDNDWCDKKDPAVSKNWDVSSQKRCGEGEHPLPALALPNEYGHSNACGQHDKILSGGKEKCLERHLCDITIIASTQASWKDDSNIQQKTQDALAECQENVRQKHDSLTEQESLCGNDNSNDLSGLTESVCRMMAVARMWPSTAGRLSNCKQTNSDGEFDEENLRNSITCINIENEDQSARGKPSSGYYCNHRNAKSSKKRRGYKENNRNTDSRCIGRSENTKTTSAYTPQSQTAVAKDKQGAHNSSVAKNGDNCIEKNFCDHAESRAGQSGSQNPIADSGYLGSFDARVSTAIGEQAINKSKKSTKLRRNAQDSKPFHCQQQDSLQQESTIDVVERQNRDCNLKIPFEKYIVGKVSSTHVEAKRDFRNDRKAGNHHSAKTLANRMRDSSERTSLKKQQAHHKDIAKPKSKTLTKSHRKLSVEQSLTQDAAGAKGNGRQHVLREASCEKNQPEEIKRECRKPLLHLRDCKDVEAEKNNENAGKNSKNRKHWRTSQHHSSKTQKPEADNPCGKRSDYQKAGNLVGSERKTRYCREEIKGGGTHIFSTETWHTRLHESKNMIRPERRNSRSKREKPTCLHSKENGHWNDRYKRSSSLLSTSSSTDSSYSTDSSLSTSSYDTISSSPKSSSGDRRVEKRYTREQYRKPYKDCTASRKPWRDSAQVDASAGNVHGSRRHKSRYKKSASSASSCHRRPAAVEPRHNSRIEKCADGVTSKVDADPHSLSPVEESNDPAFGLLRKKRLTTAAVRAEEDVYSAWQRQHVELVGPKPDLGGAGRLHHQIDNDKDRKAQQYSKPVGGAFLQQSLQRTSSSDASKRPVTINDLYSFHLVLSDTQNGMVLAGFRRKDEKRVAIKRITSESTGRWGWLDGKVVPLELVLLKQVNEIKCPGVVEIVEWWKTADSYLLIMGRPHPAVDLYDYVSKHKRIKESLARHVVKQLVNALRHCIKCGVLHRDVKLENILLNPTTKDITLIDFGCGDYYHTTPYKEFAGTPEYYPPEWFLHKHYHGEPMTVWSIGVLLYSLLSGSLPFRSSREITEKEITKFPNDISRACRDLLTSMLKKNPRDRICLGDLMSHAWLASTSRNSNSGSSI